MRLVREVASTQLVVGGIGRGRGKCMVDARVNYRGALEMRTNLAKLQNHTRPAQCQNKETQLPKLPPNSPNFSIQTPIMLL